MRLGVRMDNAQVEAKTERMKQILHKIRLKEEAIRLKEEAIRQDEYLKADTNDWKAGNRIKRDKALLKRFKQEYDKALEQLKKLKIEQEAERLKARSAGRRKSNAKTNWTLRVPLPIRQI